MPSLLINPIHLGLGATAVEQPPFSGIEWYQAYGARHAGDGSEGRLVSLYDFSENWTVWEMHPSGAEVVLCVSGAMSLHQEQADASVATSRLGPGDYAIIAPGIWHTADIDQATTAVFITAGMGTQLRPR